MGGRPLVMTTSVSDEGYRPDMGEAVTGTCTTCGMEFVGTMNDFVSVHLPRCRELSEVSRRAFYRMSWPSAKAE
jgi:hypothetical protein